MDAEKIPVGRVCSCSCGKSIAHMASHAKYARGCYDSAKYSDKLKAQKALRHARRDGTRPPIKKPKNCETPGCGASMEGRVTGARFCYSCIVVRRGRNKIDGQGEQRKSLTNRSNMVKTLGDGIGVHAREPQPKCRVCAGMRWAISLDREMDPPSGRHSNVPAVGVLVKGKVVCRGCGAEGGGDAPLPSPGSCLGSSMGTASDHGRLYGYQAGTNVMGSGLTSHRRLRPGGRAGRTRGKDNADAE